MLIAATEITGANFSPRFAFFMLPSTLSGALPVQMARHE